MPPRLLRTCRTFFSSKLAAGLIGDNLSTACGTTDAALLVERVTGELTDLSLAVKELQAGLGTAIAAAAAHDPGILLQAQKLDLVAQSLQGLSAFLSALRYQRIGREPLDFDGMTAGLDLTSLGERLAGRMPDTSEDGFELF